MVDAVMFDCTGTRCSDKQDVYNIHRYMHCANTLHDLCHCYVCAKYAFSNQISYDSKS